jgi:hypothetical protein
MNVWNPTSQPGNYGAAAVTSDVDSVSQTLDFISRKLRAAVPAHFCPHEEAPCIGCSLEWLVIEQAGLSLTPPEPEGAPLC